MVQPVGGIGGVLPRKEDHEAHQKGQKKTSLEPASPLTSQENLSKFLDLSEPVPHPKNRNDNSASLPRACSCLKKMTESVPAGSELQQGSWVTVSVLEQKAPWLWKQKARLCGLMQVT